MNLRFLFTFILILSVGFGLKGMDADRPQLPDSSAATPYDFSTHFTENPSFSHTPMVSPLSEEQENKESAVSAAVTPQGRAQAYCPYPSVIAIRTHPWTHPELDGIIKRAERGDVTIKKLYKDYPSASKLISDLYNLMKSNDNEFSVNRKEIPGPRLARENQIASQLEVFRNQWIIDTGQDEVFIPKK